ncbi:MAG TPA: hypothetical protein PLC65_08635 [Bacteroidia bacterium]|nr:hypothetical protein [Bacteroidia bacterium]
MVLQRMSLQITKQRPYLVLFALLLIFIAYFYSPVFFHPNTYVLNDKGDAIKNYFCYEWHVQHDSTYLNYSGSNYPYGEDHSFTDGNPLLSNFIRLFSFLKPFSIAIFNLTLIGSFLLCGWLLLRIFLLLNNSEYFSVIAALGITILCPQSLRLAGHLALSYNFTIPLVIYLLLKHEIQGKQIKNSILLSLVITLIFFIHPYLGMINASFVLVYWFTKSLLSFSKKNVINFAIQGITPLLVYFLFIQITDTKVDRPQNPYGFLYFTSNIETVFISVFPPFRHFLSQIYKIRGQNWEGIAYVGITSTIALFFMIYYFIRNKSKCITVLKHHKQLNPFLLLFISSVPLLLFSMGIPFKWGLESLLDTFPLIKQFRAPGRFAWPFFFMTTILSSIIISKLFFTKLHKNLRYLLSSLILLLFIADGIPFHHSMKGYLNTKNPFNETELDEDVKKLISSIPQNAQAILPLPFFHYGSDYYSFDGTEKIKRMAAIVSFHRKLPLMANFTPRTSFLETINLVHLLADDKIEKSILNNLNQSKPITVLFSKEALLTEEQNLLNKCKIIYEGKDYTVAEISTNSLIHNSKKYELDYFLNNKSKLITNNGLFTTDSSFVLFDDFNRTKNKNYEGVLNQSNTLIELSPNLLQNGKEYEISFYTNPNILTR